MGKNSFGKRQAVAAEFAALAVEQMPVDRAKTFGHFRQADPMPSAIDEGAAMAVKTAQRGARSEF